MRLLIAIILCCTFLTSALFSPVSARSTNPALNRPFDEYGNICWWNEAARLDNFAIALQNDPTATGIIIFYDGNPSCHQEAIAPAIRARKYIVEYRNIEWNHVMWRYGGHRSDMTFMLVVIPRGAPNYPLLPTLTPEDVKVKDCKAEMYRRPKCTKI